MDFSHIFDLGFYFSSDGLEEFNSAIIILGWCITLIVLGVLWSFLRNRIISHRHLRKITKKFSNKLIWFGAIGLLLFWFRLENIRYLSLRFWWVIYGIVFLILLFLSIRNFKRNLNVKVTSVAKKAKKEDKYIPIQKKKKKKKRS